MRVRTVLHIAIGIILFTAIPISVVLTIDNMRVGEGVRKAQALKPAIREAEARRDWNEAIRLLNRQIAILCEYDSFIAPSDRCGADKNKSTKR